MLINDLAENQQRITNIHTPTLVKIYRVCVCVCGGGGGGGGGTRQYYKKMYNQLSPAMVLYQSNFKTIAQHYTPDSRVCWAHIGPTWSRQDPRWSNVGSTKFAVGAISHSFVHVVSCVVVIRRLATFAYMNPWRLRIKPPILATAMPKYSVVKQSMANQADVYTPSA